MGLLLVVYITVAVANYSIVQSYLGTIAGNHFSKEWGGKVRIGSLGMMPWDHLILHEVLLVAPDGDTIFDREALRLRFKRFPFRNGDLKDGGHNAGTLSFDRVYLKNAYYHLAVRRSEINPEKAVTNLEFIISHYATNDTTRPHDNKFTVDVGMLTLNHVHYKMDLIDKRKIVFDQGVEIPHMEFYDICGRIKGVHVVNDEVVAHILHLGTEERSGFLVKDLHGDVHTGRTGIHAHNMDITTANSHIMLDADLDYGHWNEMKNYVHTVQHRAVIHEGTTVALSDVAYWAPVLWGYNAQIDAEGIITGPVDSLVIDGLQLAFGRDSRMAVDGTVRGLPDVKIAAGDIDRLDVRVAEGDAERILTMMPVKLSPALQRIIRNVQYVDMAAQLHGGMADGGTLNLNIVSGMGNLRADINARPEANAGGRNGSDVWHVGVDANSDGLGLCLLGSDWLT